MSGKISGLCVILLQLTLIACATGPNTHEQQETKQGVRTVKKPESASLYNDATSRNFFQDLRAYQVGDLVTVNIVETSSGSLLGWEGKLKYLTSAGNGNVGDAYSNSSMFKSSMTNSFNGSGTTSRNESMTAYITAKVMEVTPNGNLFIQGTREVRVNNETQHIILSGTIRPADISPDNTVLSSYIGDARIEYTGTGVLSDKQRGGWLTRIVDQVWPF
jgi:flagellar L-ring protein precursor FlgH